MVQEWLEALGSFGADVLWGPWTFFGLMGAGLLFTIWTRFTQYRSMTHGIAVVRGVYDDPDDPGAINHFQALSAALSATVGLGNIGGVALAIGAGGPGALFWMWIIGFLGMALKTVEITLAMLYRNTEDPDNPHGGAMWVVDRYLGGKGGFWKPIAKFVGVFFCVTLLISTITGGNMFQSWSVASLTKTYFDVPRVVTGIILAIVIGLVIVGGIKRIGNVAGRLVPFMCVLYLLCALAVLALNITEIPALLWLIVESAFSENEAAGAFLGGTAGFAFSEGLRRALFSNEAGQGSAPIAHAAAKTDEPAREGIVGGIGPMIDTLTICTLTALVILAPAGKAGLGTWNRAPLRAFETAPLTVPAWQFPDADLIDPASDIRLVDGMNVYVEVDRSPEADPPPPLRIHGTLQKADANGESWTIAWQPYNAQSAPRGGEHDLIAEAESGEEDYVIGAVRLRSPVRAETDEGHLLWGLLSRPVTITLTDDNAYLWDNIGKVFTVMEADHLADTGYNRYRMYGDVTLIGDGAERTLDVEWRTLELPPAAGEPRLVADTGIFREYDGAELTAHAFDRQFPGLGKWLVTFAAWLFAISTMISWSYYGEQGMIYMLGSWSVLPYKLFYLAAIVFAAVWITDTTIMTNLMDLGTGAMLWSNIPIVVCLGFLAVRSLRKYDKALKAGEFVRHDAPDIEDVVGGKDVEKRS